MKTHVTPIATTRCPHCRGRFRIDPIPPSLPCSPNEYEGRLKRCPACRKIFKVKLENVGAKAHTALSVPVCVANPNWLDNIYAGANWEKGTRHDAPTLSSLPTTIPVSRPTSGGQQRKPAREREPATSVNSDISFQDYVAESGARINRLQQALGLPPLVTGALKTASFVGRLLLSPIDYPMWRAVKRGKMRNGDRIAIQLGIVYLLSRWGTASRKRQDMADQAKYIAEAIKRTRG